jgi:3-phosphoshikimate 1-carboxyvinyltransferase
LSSQFLTGLLFAFAHAATEPITIQVVDLKSKPYIDLTLAVLQHFGYAVQHENYQQFHIHPRKINQQPIDFTVEGDWSGAAFLLVAGAIAGNLTITGLDVFSEQADKAILQALMQTGALLSITEKEIISARPQHQAALKPFQFDATDCPDLFPPLVALAACCAGTSVIEGVERLTHKESNRALTLQDTFGKMGIQIELQDNLMLIHGGTLITGAEVHSHHDHRIAMAAAVAALCANAPVKIADADAINKSYPDFYKHLEEVHQAR